MASFDRDRKHPPVRTGDAYRDYGKRAVDVASALALLLIAAPTFLIIIALQLASRGDGTVFDRHRRIGKAGRGFDCLKFCSMRPDHDPGVSRLGRVLRKTSMDELPQLWNVLRGDMSLVGPRPVTASEMTRYKALGGRELYQSVRPGLTGPGLLGGREGTYEQRVRLDRHYIQELSFRADARILVRTAMAVFRREGAC